MVNARRTLEPPDDDGKAFAWLSFLSSEAPFSELPLGGSFRIKLGRTVVGSAALRVFPKICTAYERENDFVEHLRPNLCELQLDMYLTVQRVASSRAERGINGALYSHNANRDDPMWSAPDIQHITSTNLGNQIARRTDIKPGGNAVECFLDIIFPDDFTGG